MAIIITNQKEIDLNSGVKTNVEIVDGKLQLEVVGEVLQRDETVFIPSMTSNNSPSGIASASSSSGTSFPPWRAFDEGLTNHSWRSTSSNNTVHHWLSYQFEEPKNINRYIVRSMDVEGFFDQYPRDWQFQGLDNNNDWITLDVQVNQANWTANEYRVFDFKNDDEYLAYRIYITAKNTTANVSTIIANLQMYRLHSAPIYKPSGSIEFPTVDLGKHFREVKSVSPIRNIPDGTSLLIYTSTSSDNITYSDYQPIDSEGRIASPQNRYIKIRVEFTGRSEIGEVELNRFDEDESMDFERDDLVEFSDGLRLRTHLLDQMNVYDEIDDGTLYIKQIEKSKFKKVNSLYLIMK